MRSKYDNVDTEANHIDNNMEHRGLLAVRKGRNWKVRLCSQMRRIEVQQCGKSRKKK